MEDLDEAPPGVVIRGPIAQQFYLPLIEGRAEEIPPELCFWGGTGTGKSFTLFLVLILLMTDPKIGGLRILWTRKTRKSISQSSIISFRKAMSALGLEMSSTPTPEHRQSEVFYTESGMNELVWMSLEDPYNAFSAEYDIVVYEEGIQNTEGTYELAGGRCLRNNAIPWQGMILVTNPGPKVGWIYRRMFVTKKLTDCQVTIHDNPAYWDIDEDRYTPEGEAFMERITHVYHGANYLRLVKAQWASEEGWALDCFNESEHVFVGEWTKAAFTKPKIALTQPHPHLPQEIEIEWTFGSMDLGFNNAGVLQAWGVDAEGHLFLLEEVYYTQKDRDWWAEQIVRLSDRYFLDCIVADHDPEDHRHYNRVIAERCENRSRPADGEPYVRRCKKTRGEKDLQKVTVIRTLLHHGVDGMPRCFLNANARKHEPDPGLIVDAKPDCLLDEIPQLVWKQLPDNKVDEKLPEEKLKEGRANHAFDAWVYAGRYYAGRHEQTAWDEDKPEFYPGSFEHHVAAMEKKGWKTVI